MELFRSLSRFHLRRTLNLHSSFRANTGARCFCTVEKPLPVPRGWADTLYTRLMLVSDPCASVVPVLEKWVEEGKPVDQNNLQDIVKQFKGRKRYAQALEISMWMSDRRYFNLSPGNHACRLKLIYKARGLQHAENYFNNISKQLKLYQPYCALINCYAEEKSVEKTEALFQEMKELSMVSTFAYNVLLRLYFQTGQYGRVDTMFQEMEEKNIPLNIFTYNILMDLYASVEDIKGMQNLMKRLKDSELVANWHVYAVVAKGFMKAGLKDEAVAAMKNSEKLIPHKRNHIAYGFILTVYADFGNKDEVYRIWNRYTSSEKASNSMYMCMISALVKLDDIEGAEAILKEWESQFTFFDFRVPTLLIAAYCKRALVGKAESLMHKAMESGGTPYAFTWDHLAGGYFKVDESLKAVETMKKALMAGQPGWKPNPMNVNASLEYFIGKKDVEGAEEFVKLLQRLGPLTREGHHQLLRIYMAAGKSVSYVLNQMKVDGFDADEETNKILEAQC